MDARTQTLANGWIRLETLPSSLTRPSSKRWLVEERNSTTRNSASPQAVGSCGSMSARGQVTVDTSLAKVAFCGAAAAIEDHAARTNKLDMNRQTTMFPSAAAPVITEPAG